MKPFFLCFSWFSLGTISPWSTVISATRDSRWAYCLWDLGLPLVSFLQHARFIRVTILIPFLVAGGQITPGKETNTIQWANGISLRVSGKEKRRESITFLKNRADDRNCQDSTWTRYKSLWRGGIACRLVSKQRERVAWKKTVLLNVRPSTMQVDRRKSI